MCVIKSQRAEIFIDDKSILLHISLPFLFFQHILSTAKQNRGKDIEVFKTKQNNNNNNKNKNLNLNLNLDLYFLITLFYLHSE